MSTSAIGTELDSIQAGLSARLIEVPIFTGEVDIRSEGVLECVVIGSECELTQVEHAMGGAIRETWRVSGELAAIVKSYDTDTETTIKAARDRALEIFAEVETYLNDTYTGQVPDVSVRDGVLRNGIHPDGRYCSLEFYCDVLAVKNP